MSLDVPLGLLHCDQCGETFLEEECPSCQRGELATPWVLTDAGWRQPRLDGTVWMLQPGDPSVLVPDSSKGPLASHLHSCEQGLTFRTAIGVECPGCGGTSALGSSRSDEGNLPAENGDTRLAPVPDQRPGSTVNKWAWVVAGATAVFLALAVANAEYGLGIFGESDISAPDEADETNTSDAIPVTTVVSRVTSMSRVTTTSRATTTSTSTDVTESVGWIPGSCVAFSGEFAEPVPCGAAHDAIVVDMVASEDDCPRGTDWTVDLSPDIACLEEGALSSGSEPGSDSIDDSSDGWIEVSVDFSDYFCRSSLEGFQNYECFTTLSGDPPTVTFDPDLYCSGPEVSMTCDEAWYPDELENLDLVTFSGQDYLCERSYLGGFDDYDCGGYSGGDPDLVWMGELKCTDRGYSFECDYDYYPSEFDGLTITYVGSSEYVCEETWQGSECFLYHGGSPAAATTGLPDLYCNFSGLCDEFGYP